MKPERIQTPTSAPKRGGTRPLPPRTFLTDKTLFAEALKRLRTHQSDSVCASRAGVSLQTWRRWERGQERPGDEQIARILDALDASADRFDLEVLRIMMERIEGRDLSFLQAANDPEARNDPARLLATLQLTAETFCSALEDLEVLLAPFFNRDQRPGDDHDAR